MNVLLTTCNASYIHKNLALRWLYVMRPPEFSVSIKEFTINDDPQKILNHMSQGWDVIALSVYIWNSEIIAALIQDILQFKPKPMIVVGGPEVTYTSQRWLDIGADIVIRGEGEEAFWQALKGNLTFEGVCTKNHFSQNVAIADISRLEKVESPYFLNFDLPNLDKQYLYVESSRGCPFECTYCLSSIEKGLRIFSEDYMKTLIERIGNSNVKQVKFLDRTFNLFPVRALSIAKAMNDLKSDVIVQFECEVTALSKELEDFFALEADKHRFRFEIGVQSFYPPTLQAVKRYQNNEQVKRIIQRWSNAGLTVHADLIAGLPLESLEQFKNSFLQLFRIQPQEIQVGILKCLPQTLLSVQAQSMKYVFQNIAPYSVLQTPWLSENDMKDITALALCTDKTVNLPRAKTLWHLLDDRGFDVVKLMIECGKKIEQLKHPYQLKDIIHCVIDVGTMCLGLKETEAAIMTDVAKLSKVTPQRWFEFDLSDEVRQIILHHASVASGVSYDVFRRKGWLHYAIQNNALCVQCWLYTPQYYGNYGYYSLEGEPL
ncbi:MAG: B12-binding domain-containing radical SAM protein [Firmicutes bacterium HGW-Firmicutes-19]|jgi:anaerobic magnesium-protoporphyrin IX monomethyl ester cyclase|nr:MAG: B12-binding domain-containing radical SAM protein [Firmicutes bacterium HGW-Firmicutes-19]